MSTDACWIGHFPVEPGIFVSHRALLCQTMHFAVEPGFLCRTSVIMMHIYALIFDQLWKSYPIHLRVTVVLHRQSSN